MSDPQAAGLPDFVSPNTNPQGQTNPPTPQDGAGPITQAGQVPYQTQPGVPGQYPGYQPDPQTGQLLPEQHSAVVNENVGRGLLLSLIAVIAGVALTVAIWQFGFIASITALALAAGAVWMYSKGAGCAPRKGVAPLIILIIVGVLLSIAACIVSDGVIGLQEVDPGMGLGDAISITISVIAENPSVLTDYGRDIAMLLLFAGLGTFSTLRALGGRS